MSFQAIETSTDSGSPITLFEFTYGAIIYRYTNAAKVMTKDGQNFIPAVLSFPELKVSDDPNQCNVTVSAFRTFPVADIFRGSPPASEVRLKIWQKHYLDLANEYLLMFQGRVLDAAWSGNKTDLNCESDLVSQKRIGLRRMQQKNCPYDLYDATTCRVDKNAFVVTTTDYDAFGTNISSPVFATYQTLWFQGGYIEYTNLTTGLVERRHISMHVGDDLTLYIPASGLVAPSPLKVYPGCPRSAIYCNDKFNNIVNFGGIKDIPRVNPFVKNTF